uniref:ArsR/SmtB family transcription factor n=1 Tax=Streptomyces acidicola TaxID=2596892 RepID=UPI0037FDC985
MPEFPAEEEPTTDEPTGRADAYEAVFSALAHPARRRVVLTVYFNGGSMTAGEIAAVFAHSWQTTTRHLQVLEAAGLLSSERQGRSRVYRLQRSRLDLVTQWLAHFSQQHGPPDRNQGEPLT